MRLLELFSGTGSVGRVFRSRGWEVVSLDVDPQAGADITANILSWDYRVFPPDHFQCIWASPPCTEYSIARTKAKTPRNLALADSIVQRTLDIFAYFGCLYWMENPATGLLGRREVVQSLPDPYVVSYCMFGRPYRKNTYLWTNVPFCDIRCNQDCGAFSDGRHESSAQRCPKKGLPGWKLSDLHAIPEGLVEKIEAATAKPLALPVRTLC